MSAAVRPIASASIASTEPANVSAKPLPPSGPVTTVVSEAWVDGAQQNWPSLLAIASSTAIVS